MLPGPVMLMLLLPVPRTSASSRDFTVLKLAGDGGATGVLKSALAVPLAVLILAGKRAAISPRHGALAMPLAVLPLAGIRFAIGKGRGALAVALAFAICLAGVRHAASISAASSCRPTVGGRGLPFG